MRPLGVHADHITQVMLEAMLDQGVHDGLKLHVPIGPLRTEVQLKLSDHVQRSLLIRATLET